jgi:hypothetical protein
MKTYVKIALFVVAFIVLSGILAGIYMFNLKHTDMAKAKPDFVLTATELQKAFENDETNASKKFINKIVEVSGRISLVKPSENNVISISLETGSDLSSVICTLPAVTDPSRFKAGQELTIRGECSGFLMDVLMNNCAAINSK